MNLKITHKTSQPLLSRTKVEAELSYDKTTPSKKEVQASIAKSMGTQANLVVVDVIDNVYGLHEAKVVAYAYENEKVIGMTIKEGKKSIEKRKKQQEAEAAKKAEAEKKATEEKKAKEEKSE